MAIVRRENIQQIADKNKELEALEAQYRTLSRYDAPFGFALDYADNLAPSGRKKHFELDIIPADDAYRPLIAVLKDRVRASIYLVCGDLNAMGVKIDTNVLIGFLDAEPVTDAKPDLGSLNNQSVNEDPNKDASDAAVA